MGKKYLLMLACCLMLLVGCTSQAYKDAVSSGKAAMEQKDYTLAIKAFQQATESEPKETEAKELLSKAVAAQEQALRTDIDAAIKNHSALIEKKEWDQSIEVINDIKGSLSGYETSFAKEIQQLEQLNKQSMAGKENSQGKEKLTNQLFDEALTHFESAQKLVDSEEAKSMMTETLKKKSAYEEDQKRLAFAIKNNVYKFVMSDTDEKQIYDVYLFSESEKIQVIDLPWACAVEGDRLYSGNYNLAIVAQGTKEVKFFPIGEHQINYDNKEVFIVDGNPDLFAISTCQGSNISTVSYWYLHNGELKGVSSENGEKEFEIFRGNIKSAGPSTYQSVNYYNGGDITWVFNNWTLDVETGVLKHDKSLTYTWQRSDEASILFERFRNEKDFIVVK